MKETPREAVRHEPIVSETLKHNADHTPSQVEQAEELPTQDHPRKQHGDALLDGSGTRHGVHEAQERPNV